MMKVVYFRATWANPCDRQDTILDEVEEYFEGESIDFEISRVDVDEKRRKADAGVEEIPTLLVEKDEDVLEMFVGVTGKEDIVECVEEHSG